MGENDGHFNTLRDVKENFISPAPAPMSSIKLNKQVRETYRLNRKCLECHTNYDNNQEHFVYLIRYCICRNRIVIRLKDGYLMEGKGYPITKE